MDRPGTGYTQILNKKQRKALRERAQTRFQQQQQQQSGCGEEEQEELNDDAAVEENHKLARTHRRSRSSLGGTKIAELASSLLFSSSSSSSSSSSTSSGPSSHQQQSFTPRNSVQQRIDEVCHEVIDWLDIVLDKNDPSKPPTKVSLMSHSCGVYYVMRMLALYPDRVKEGPVCLLTPWVPFNECPTTTSSTFKAVRYVPRGMNF